MSKVEHLDPISLRGLRLGHLRLMAELRAAGRLGTAAEKLGLQQPAASRLLGDIESIFGYPVHVREGRGLRLTAAGEALARRAERILIELSDAARDMEDAASGAAGHVRIGSVTGPALNHLLPVLKALHAESPAITAEIVVSTSDLLCDSVLNGRLDFILGRIPPGLQAEFDLQLIGEEPLALVVRRGHPLLMRPVVSIDDLQEFDWVMSEEESLLSRTVMRWLANAGYPKPKRWISTSSFLFTLAVLKETDAVAPLAQPVVESFTEGMSMPFVQVPLDMGVAVEAFGIVSRKNAELPPAVRRVAAMILSRARTAA